MLQAETQCGTVQGNLSLEVKNGIERRFQGTEMCKETIDHGFFLSSRRTISTELRGWSIKTADLGTSIWQIPHTFDVFMSEDKIQNPSKCLFQLSLGGNVMDHRSGDGRFGGRLKITALNSGFFLISTNFEMLDARIASSLNKIIENSLLHKKKDSLEEQKAQKEDPFFLRGRQIAYLIYDYFQVTVRSKILFENYARAIYNYSS